MSSHSSENLAAAQVRAHWFARVLLIVLGLGLWFFTQSLIGSRPYDPEDAAAGAPISRGDTLFQLTASINAYLHEHPQAADSLLIASSAAIDAMGLWLIASSIFGPTMRPFIGLLLLFSLRQVTQSLCMLPTPEGMIWRDPDVPSLLVTYHVANDSFFSGHTAIAVFAASQLARRKRPALLALGVALALFEIFTVIFLRAHYTMDVIAGAVAAVWAAHAADYLAPWVDRMLAAWWPAKSKTSA